MRCIGAFIINITLLSFWMAQAFAVEDEGPGTGSQRYRYYGAEELEQAGQKSGENMTLDRFE